jgi:hypothetical protein
MRFAIIDAVAAFVLISALLALSIMLQNDIFSMAGPAGVFTLGSIFIVGLIRFAFLPNQVKAFFLVGGCLAALWYPFLLVLLSTAEAGGPSPLSLAFYWYMLTSLQYREACAPTLSVVLFSATGALVGSFLHRFKGRSDQTPRKPPFRTPPEAR